MSCAIVTFSARTAYAASATTRSLTARASSSSSAIQRSSQGNMNSKRCQKSKLHDTRPFSTVPKWTEDGGDSGTVMGLTAVSALITAGCTAAYIAYESKEEDSTAHCSSVGMATEYDKVTVTVTALKEAVLFGPGLKRMLGLPTSHSEHLGSVGQEAIDNSANSVSSGSSSAMTRQPKTDALKSGMFEVVEASVQQASTWEKKAMAVVDELRKPSRYDVSVRALKGGRLYMEDTFCIHDGGRFAGVFDGHGGAGVSKYTSKTIYDKINKFKAELESTPTSTPSLATIVKSIGYAFEELDNDVLSVDELQYQGSTAVTVYVHEDSQTRERTIVSANIGDSRAILSRGYVAVDLTRDHKPDDEHEKERILAMGETIEWDSYCQVSRVKNLSLSRALGDRFAKPVVSGEAEIQLFHLDEIPTTHGGEDDCIILASDGLWDVMTSQDCVDFVKKRLTPSEAQTRNMSKGELLRQKISRRKNMSRIVANEATRRGSYDNVCVVIIWLDEPNGTLRD